MAAHTGAPRNRVFRAFSRPLGAIAQLGERLVRNEEVGGSIPPGSTSLRRFAATAGKPLAMQERFNVREAANCPAKSAGENGLDYAMAVALAFFGFFPSAKPPDAYD